jgi:pimeloyl-ACP methyl ester carboxylesterase
MKGEHSMAGSDAAVGEFAEVNGTRLHYIRAGEGQAVVLLHGWPFTSLVWRPLLPLLAEAGFTAIAPDLRGLGESQREEEGYGKPEVAADVRELAAQLGFERVDLVGMDVGSMVAAAYALDTPERVRHLVLSESLLPGFGLEEAMNPATGGYWHFGFQMQVELATFLTAGKEAAYLSPGWDQFSLGLTDADKAELLRQYTAEGAMRAGFQHYGTLIEDGRWNRKRLADMGKLSLPVLVLGGERGLPREPLVAGARQIAEDVEEDVVPDAAHTIGLDNPRWLADRLARFFAADSD